MGLIVVDASVAIKWLLPENGVDEARLLLRQGERRLVAPNLVSLEVMGAVLRRHRERTLSEEQVAEVRKSWNGMIADGALILTSNSDVFDRAFDISLNLRHPLKDCLYLALAEQEKAELVTADQVLHKRGGAIHQHITLIGRLA